jgi:hypothetical protein
MQYAITLSALAILVALGAVAALFDTRTKLLSLSLACQDLSSKLRNLENSVSRTSNAGLAAEVEGMGAAFDKLAKSMRKQFGAVWAEFQQRELELKHPADQDSRAALRAAHLPRSIGQIPQPKAEEA